MAILAPVAVQQFFDNSGALLVGGQLFTYLAGTDTKTPTYTTAAGNVPNTNPIVLDARGEAEIWLDPEIAYKFVLAAADDTDPPTSPIWTVDNIAALGITAVIGSLATIAALRAYAGPASDGAGIYVGGYRASDDGGEGAFVYVAADTTSADNGGTIITDAESRRWYRDLQGLAPSPQQFGAYGTGSVGNDDTTAVLACIAAAGPTRCIRGVAGSTYRISQALVFTDGSKAIGVVCSGGFCTFAFVTLSGSTDCVTIAGASMVQSIFENVVMDGGSVGQDLLVCAGGDHVIYRNVFLKNAGRDAMVGSAVNGQFIQNWLWDNVKISGVGRHLVRLETAGAAGSFINSITMSGNEWRGVGAGGNPIYVKAAGTVLAAQISSVVGDVDIDFENQSGAQANPNFIFFDQDTTAGSTGNSYIGWHITRGGWENSGDPFTGAVYAPFAQAAAAAVVSDMSFDSIIPGAWASPTTPNISPVKLDSSTFASIKFRVYGAWAEGGSALVNPDAVAPGSSNYHLGRWDTVANVNTAGAQVPMWKIGTPADQNDGAAQATSRKVRVDLAANTAGQTVTIPQIIGPLLNATDDQNDVLVMLSNHQYTGSGNVFIRTYQVMIDANGACTALQLADGSTANMITAVAFSISGQSLVLTVTTGTNWGAGGGYTPLKAVALTSGFCAA